MHGDPFYQNVTILYKISDRYFLKKIRNYETLNAETAVSYSTTSPYPIQPNPVQGNPRQSNLCVRFYGFASHHG
jgi:hypothetical protein